MCSLEQLNKLLQATNTVIQALSTATVRGELLNDGISALSLLIKARYGAIVIIKGGALMS